MSLRDRLNRMVRRSNTSATGDADRKTSSKSDNSNKNSSQSTVGRMLSGTFSRRGKSSTSSASSAPGSRSNANFGDSPSSTPNQGTSSRASPAFLDGMRWEDMTDAQRMQATFNAYEIRFGASNPGRASLEGISPCTTRTRQHPDPEQADYY